uniref:MADF domain-containing protein n=1 Tax=Dendroctonus ponderosae TaxID=77166 RepID=A0AAR5QBD8_DENPD
MEWDHDLCLKLIELYKSKPELWNSRHSLYRVRSKKREAWDEIANQLGTSTDILKLKLNSLLASYRRERSKEIKGMGKDLPDGGKNQWFAYEAFQFLSTKNGSRRPSSTNVDKKLKCVEVKVEEPHLERTYFDEIDEEMGQESDIGMPDKDVSWEILEPDLSTMKDFTNTALSSKRLAGIKRKYDNEGLEDDHRIAHSFSSIEQRNSCDVYGEHIALKLRSYSKTTQSAVQHLFGNILFKADMGVYDRELQNYSSGSGCFSGKTRTPSPTS